jgi:hypothetical protein
MDRLAHPFFAARSTRAAERPAELAFGHEAKELLIFIPD